VNQLASPQDPEVDLNVYFRPFELLLLLAIPQVVLLALALWRRAPWRWVARTAALLAFVSFSLVVLSLTVSPHAIGLSSSPPDWPRLLRYLVPFRDLTEMLSDPSISPASFRWNVAGNVLLFVPLGFLLPSLRPVNWPRLLLAGLLASVSIEGTQLLQNVFMGADHVVSSDDVLLNVIGASVGYASFLAVRHAARRRSEHRCS
jgi:glycopeptide antibiotics resistance protein